MTGRTLTASPATAEPDEAAVAALLDTASGESHLWEVIGDLWKLGARYHPLYDKTQRLKAQLDDPALAGHPDRDTATLRLQRWQNELQDIEGKAGLLRRLFCAFWRQMPAARRKSLQEEPGFPRAEMPEQVAGEAWVMAKTGRPYLPGEAPF